MKHAVIATMLLGRVLLCGARSQAQQQIVCSGSGYITLESPFTYVNCGSLWLVSDTALANTLLVYDIADNNSYYIALAPNTVTVQCDASGDQNACVSVTQGAESVISGKLSLAISLTGTERE